MFAKILHRPALAIVISILILFLGALAINTLPISQFPSVAPPSVVVTVAYPGASANVLVDSVLIPLEQAINGVQDMRYMASAATSAGEATIQIIFEPGTDPNVAVLNVNNRIATVKNRLPPLVEREGIIVMQAMTSMLMYVNVFSTQKGVDQNFLYNFVNVNVLPEIKRIRGVGSATILGSRQYAMRVWLNMDRMRAYRISADDVMKALGQQSMIGSPRPPRAGHRPHLADRRVRPHLRRPLQQGRPVQGHHPPGQPRRRDPPAQGHRRGRAGRGLL